MKIPTRIAFSFLFCFIILSKSNFLAKAQNTTISVNVGVILDFDTWTGNMGLSCINMALADFYASHNHFKTRLHLHSRDSKCDVVEAAAGGKSSSLLFIPICRLQTVGKVLCQIAFVFFFFFFQSLSAEFSSYCIGTLRSCSNGLMGIK